MHMPFLYQAAKEGPNGIPKIVPIVAGSTTSATEKKLGEILAPYLLDEENTFVVSTDFCHWYEPRKRFCVAFANFTGEEDSTTPPTHPMKT